MFGVKSNSALDKVNALIQDCIPLAIFGSNLLAIVTTDASGYGLGTILQQEHPEGIKTVPFVSRTLMTTELDYSTDEKRHYHAYGFVKGGMCSFLVAGL